MDIMSFVKNDIAKLGKAFNGKSLKTIATIGGFAMMAVNLLNERNDREAMKNEIADDLLKKLGSGEDKK